MAMLLTQNMLVSVNVWSFLLLLLHVTVTTLQDEKSFKNPLALGLLENICGIYFTHTYPSPQPPKKKKARKKKIYTM